MKKLKVTALLLAVIAFVCSFSGCSDKAKYKAELYNVDEKFIRTDFAENNRISGARYFNEDDPENPRFRVDDAPKTRTFIVRNKETYDEIFSADAYMVNFAKESLIVYTFSDVYIRRYDLKKIDVEGKKLVIYYKLHYTLLERFASIGDAVAPYQRWFALKLEKTDISKVEFIEKWR